jgi:starch phosphorylase
VQVFLGGLDAGAVRVELFADAGSGGEAVRMTMGRGDGDWYSARVPATRGAGDFTVRVVPEHSDAMVPLEAGEILWQR